MKKLLFPLIIFLFIFAGGIGIFLLLDSFTGSGITEAFYNQIKDEVIPEEEIELSELSVTLNDQPIEVIESQVTTIVTSNYPITAESSRLELQEIKESDDGIITYVLIISNIGVGTANVSLDFVDENGRTLEFSREITRSRFPLPYGEDLIEPWDGTTYISNPDDLLVSVTKTNRLPSDYEPYSLINISTDLLLYSNAEDLQIREDAGFALKSMLEQMQREINKNVVVASGYRSYNNQVETYTGWVSGSGQEAADKFSARPGYSEHQTGLVVDFFNEETDFQFTEEFDNTAAGVWLRENAHLFGFVQSYPEGSEGITGYQYEAWQYRFIGRDNAAEQFESGLNFPEWLGQMKNDE